MEASRRCRPRTALSLFFAAASLLAPGASQAAPQVLRHQADALGDVAVFGNTLAFDCGAGQPAPAGATASCAGQLNIDDTAPDLYWRDDVADASITPTQARTSATLSLPPNAKVTYARLYWSALKVGDQPDKSAVLDWLGGPAVTINADATWVQSYGFSTHPDWYYYQSSGDATDFVAQWGAGDFRISDVEALPLAGIDVDRAFSAWTLVVFYENEGDELRNLALFDGFTSIDPGLAMGSAQVNLQGFLVPPGYKAKMAAFAYEGDQAYGGDHFTINGTKASNGVNPVDNFFNSSRSYLGVAQMGDYDVPQLSGAPGTMAGYDLDTVDITANVKAGDTTATVGADSTKDIFLLGGFVTSITNKAPDFAVFSKKAVDVNGGALLPGDIVEYTISAKNTGNDTAIGAAITDVLEDTVLFDPGSIEIVEGGAVGKKTDNAGDDQGDYNGATKTVTFRVGSGATSSAGGMVAPGDQVTVKFRVKVVATMGAVANQAVLTGKGAAGTPQKTWKSDGDPSAIGSQPTVITINECQSDAMCPAEKPHCDTATNTCQPCKADADCSDPKAPACQPNGTCGQCNDGNIVLCTPDKPVCNPSSGTCTICTTGPKGDATKCATATTGPKCVTSTDNQNFCGCTTDSDCGTVVSGKVCDSAVTLTCIEGCRGIGGNGCPTGLTCTSKDSSIGKCVQGGSPEDTDATCSDGKDNDQDGKIDCADTGCSQNSMVTVCGENTDAKCKDGVDNDGDGTIDCDDKDCQTDKITVCKSPENTNEKCSDGKDNDGDGKIDCADDDCLTGENVTVCQSDENTDPKCSDGKDNDGDGLVDCKDPDCSKNPKVTVCPKENTDATCKDGQDNDGDGLVDCKDPDCNMAPVTVCGAENTEPKCKDGIDNDGDGKIDCQDPDCEPIVTACPTPENTDPKCSDKLDNDGDGKVDCDDSDCANTTPCKGGAGGSGGAGGAGGSGGGENTNATCSDGKDNDGDGKVDCDDTDCSNNPKVTVCGENTDAKCSDGKDNDGDGLTDCDDSDCSEASGVTVCSGKGALASGDGQDVNQDGGCGCAVPGHESAPRGSLAVLGLAAGVAMLSTRRRRQR